MLKRLSKMSLAVFMTSLPACVMNQSVTTHPSLLVDPLPAMPAFTRTMLNCGHKNPITLPLCKRILIREVILKDHIETLNILIDAHNKELGSN